MTATAPVKENKMGILPIHRLVLGMSLPMMISMLVQALYNIVDSYFVGMYDASYGVAALTVAFPLQNLMIAFGAGTGVGINALLSRSLGEKNYEQSDAAANNGIFLAAVNYVIFLVLNLTVAGSFVRSQLDTKESAIAIGYAVSYLGIVLCLSFGLFFQMTFERLLQATGRTHLSMISQITGAVANIILDYLMIFGKGPFPELGVAGAAYATVIGQCLAACVGLFLNIRFNRELHLSLSRVLHPSRQVIGRIYYVGIPTIAMMAIGSVMSYLMNLILGRIGGRNAITVFGIYFKLQSFFFMPVFGLNNGIIPILAYNLGARKPDRIRKTLSFALKLAFGIMLAGTIVFWLFPEQLMHVFSAPADVTSMGAVALRTISIHFPIAAIGIVLGSTFQAFSESMYSLWISLSRQLIVLIPTAFLLSLTGNIDAVWFCFVIAEVVSLILSVTFYRKVAAKCIAPLEQDTAAASA